MMGPRESSDGDADGDEDRGGGNESAELEWNWLLVTMVVMGRPATRPHRQRRRMFVAENVDCNVFKSEDAETTCGD